MIDNEGRSDTHMPGTSPPTRPSRRRPAMWIAVISVAAISAVAVLILAALPEHQARAPASSWPTSRLLGPFTRSGYPPFVLDLNSASRAPGLSVLSAANGRLITELPPPNGFFYRDTAATADARTFVVAAEALDGACETWLYRLRLTPQGHEAALTPLKVPRISGQILPTSGLSVSADGRLVAYSATPCSGRADNSIQQRGVIGIINLDTRKTRTWRLSSASAWSLSLSPDGRLLTYVSSIVYGGDGTVRSLTVSTPPGPVTERTHVVLPAELGMDVNGSIAVNYHDAIILACSEQSHIATLAAYDVASGRRLGVVYAWHHVDVAPCEISLTPSGRFVLVYNLNLHGVATRIDLKSGTMTELAFRSTSQPLGVSW
jgi:hypothetical protein